MGLREHALITLTISCAFVDRFLRDLCSYGDAKDLLQTAPLEIVMRERNFEVHVHVNTADDLANGSVYVTVSGASAEAGDDGQTGRGNRANGLITPLRPMTLEAMAGKNPVTHVGKLYNAAATRIAHAIVTSVPGITAAECYLPSQIGAPVDSPRMAHVRVRNQGRALSPDIETRIRDIVKREIAGIPELWKPFLAETILVA